MYQSFARKGIYTFPLFFFALKQTATSMAIILKKVLFLINPKPINDLNQMIYGSIIYPKESQKSQYSFL